MDWFNALLDRLPTPHLLHPQFFMWYGILAVAYVSFRFVAQHARWAYSLFRVVYDEAVERNKKIEGIALLVGIVGVAVTLAGLAYTAFVQR